MSEDKTEICSVCFQDDAEPKFFTMAAHDPRAMCSYCIMMYRIEKRAIQYSWVLKSENLGKEIYAASIIAELLCKEETDA